MRIGINVPDDLLKRMEPLKTVTNVSQICRDAIKTHVGTYERAMTRAKEDGMNSVVERLGDELTQPTVDWELLGIEDAKMWVQLAKLDDFEALVERLEIFKTGSRSPYEVPIPIVQGVKFFEERSNDYNEWFDRQIELDLDANPYIKAKLVYQTGKISYIIAVWQMAQEKAKKRYEASVISLEKAKREARNQIKVPDHLVDSSG